MYRYGMLPALDAPQRLLAGIDPRDDFEWDVDELGRPVHDADHIWEDPTGISIFRHPEAMLRDDPDLTEAVLIWRSGANHELSVSDLAERSIFFVSCWSIMRQAYQRELKRGRPGDSDG